MDNNPSNTIENIGVYSGFYPGTEYAHFGAEFAEAHPNGYKMQYPFWNAGGTAQILGTHATGSGRAFIFYNVVPIGLNPITREYNPPT